MRQAIRFRVACFVFNGPFDGGNLVHYGGDSGNSALWRKGTRFFFNNTVIIRGEERTRWNTVVFHLETRDEQADVRNNIVFREGRTHSLLTASSRRAVSGAAE